MVHRHPRLYSILALIFLCMTIGLMLMAASSTWPLSTRAGLLILSFFPLILSLSYFLLRNYEERGY